MVEGSCTPLDKQKNKNQKKEGWWEKTINPVVAQGHGRGSVHAGANQKKEGGL